MPRRVLCPESPGWGGTAVGVVTLILGEGAICPGLPGKAVVPSAQNSNLWGGPAGLPLFQLRCPVSSLCLPVAISYSSPSPGFTRCHPTVIKSFFFFIIYLFTYFYQCSWMGIYFLLFLPILLIITVFIFLLKLSPLSFIKFSTYISSCKIINYFCTRKKIILLISTEFFSS